MADVLVNVAAEAGKGKSTITAIIVDALERAGIKVEVDGSVDQPVNLIRSTAALVDKGAVVKVTEIQLARNSSLD